MSGDTMGGSTSGCWGGHKAPHQGWAGAGGLGGGHSAVSICPTGRARMGCVHCKEKMSGKGQGGSSTVTPAHPPSQYDPDPTQLSGAFTHIPDFNNFHAAAVPPPAPFSGPSFYPCNTLQAHSSITGQWGACWQWGWAAPMGAGWGGLSRVPSTPHCVP